MSVQLNASRHKKPRVLLKTMTVEALTKLANDKSAGKGKQRQKAQNELVQRGLSW